MKGCIHKGLISAVVATAFVSLWAAPVTCDQARSAVGNWLKADSGLGCRLGRSVASARTCSTTNGVNFHVVKLEGGGFVVTSADTTQEPVVAFSDSDDLVASAENPLWGILQADFSRRARTTNAVPRAVSAPTAAEARWAALLSDAPVARAGNGIASVSDERVGEILRSKWGQTKNSVWDNWGDDCYNLFTPNNYPCGCVATALAQIMRHNCYPSAARVVTRACVVTSTTNNYSTSGTSYDWANMPLIPEVDDEIDWYAGGSSSTECAAIGKLTYECGIAMQMHWNSGPPDKPLVSSSYGAFAFEPLTNVFRFANARSYIAKDSGNLSADVVKQIMLPNLDAGYPVMLGIAAHEVIADGYGFSGGQLYTHLNMGWSGTDNAWYSLPYVEPAEMYEYTGYSSSIVNHLTYNIFTNETGELLSGRVVDGNGNPIANALVSVSSVSTGATSGGTATSGGAVLATTLTNDRGIYFFRLPGACWYRVTASDGTFSQTLSDIWLPRSINPSSVNLLTAGYNEGDMAAGNSWGNDFVFDGRPFVAMPEFDPPPGLFHPATNVTISCATSGATIRYTLDGSTPDATSPEFGVAGPIAVTTDTTIKARAFMAGMNPSPVVTATYVYDVAQDRPPGDFFSRPIPISGTEGFHNTTPNNNGYTLEDGEPWHTRRLSEDGSYYSYALQYRSIWYSWTAPGSGTMTFNAQFCGSWGYGYYPSILAVYVGDTVDTAERIVFNTECDASLVTPVSFAVEQGVTYHIVSASFWDDFDFSVQLSWSGNLVSSTPEPRTLYVNAALPDNMQQDGLSATTAFHDLPAAMGVLQDGDTVLVAPGTYSPAVVTASNVTIKATGAVAETIIDGDYVNACCSVDLENDSASGAFEGFTLVNGGGVNFADEFGLWSYRGGGALFVTLTRCVISNCWAAIGGGAHGCNLRNCLIANNVAGAYAGGASKCVLVGCTVAGNSATSYCGGIDCDSVATNCIIWGNAVDNESSVNGPSPDFEVAYWGAAAQLAYCCSSSLADGVGNLADDPKFRDAAAGDYRLRPNSTCLDAATLADISSTETDLAGNVRIQGLAPDMGAFEGSFAIPSIRLLSDGCRLYSASAQTGTAAFECDSSWHALCDAGWISFPVVSGSGDRDAFGFTLAANPSDVVREATVCLVDDGANNAITFQVRQAAAPLPPAVTNRYFGLFVGLNEYDVVSLRGQGVIVGSLTGSVLDATNVCARFTNWGFCRREDALILTNNLATVSAIRMALTNIAAQAVAGDTVLYYHSGHGYLATGTTVALVGYANLYWDYDLAADLGLFADGVRVVVMADTCHSGGLFKGTGTRGRRTFNLAERVQSIMSNNRLRTSGGLRRGSGTSTSSSTTSTTSTSSAQIGWMTAADYNQSSWDTDSGGRFTVACLEGWRTGVADLDGDGRVNFYDLWRYAKDAGAQDGETEGQCFNEELLMSVLAGVTDNSASEAETFNTPVRVSYSWLNTYMQDLGFTPSGGGTATGGALYSFADYAAAAERTKTTARGQTISVWQDFVAGTDPADSNSVFTASVSVTNGIPYIFWTPDLGTDERDYIIYGREDLTGGSWGPTNAASRFFKVEVRMK